MIEKVYIPPIKIQGIKTKLIELISGWDDVPMYMIEDRLVQNIREVLKENIKMENDIYDRKVYSLDVWMER